jgi:hypothetical protein
MPLIDKQGVYFDILDHDYHGDPCKVPSLSSSIARILYEETPLHARYWHPRLRPPKPDEIEKPDRTMAVGSAVHKVMLGKGRYIDTTSTPSPGATSGRATTCSRRSIGAA